jgi:hypothetical protein
MRYRKLTTDAFGHVLGDYTFGFGANNFYVDVPDAAGQAAYTRLRLIQGEWFLDLREGTPWNTQILGKGTVPLYDRVIKERVLGTQGLVNGINTNVIKDLAGYDSQLDGIKRHLSVDITVDTVFGVAPVSLPLVTLT